MGKPGLSISFHEGMPAHGRRLVRASAAADAARGSRGAGKGERAAAGYFGGKGGDLLFDVGAVAGRAGHFAGRRGAAHQFFEGLAAIIAYKFKNGHKCTLKWVGLVEALKAAHPEFRCLSGE